MERALSKAEAQTLKCSCAVSGQQQNWDKEAKGRHLVHIAYKPE